MPNRRGQFGHRSRLGRASFAKAAETQPHESPLLTSWQLGSVLGFLPSVGPWLVPAATGTYGQPRHDSDREDGKVDEGGGGLDLFRQQQREREFNRMVVVDADVEDDKEHRQKDDRPEERF